MKDDKKCGTLLDRDGKGMVCLKTVLVTGAAGGMGAAICKRLTAEGWQVFGLDIREPRLPGVIGHVCDVTDLASLEGAVTAYRSACGGRLDAIVHTAGIYDLDALSEMDDARFRRIFEINVFGAARINRLFTPLMGPGGRITIITSELAPLDPLPFTGIYAVTKAALDRYAFSLRSELALRDIRVSIVRPGAVSTGLLNVSNTALDRFVANTKYFRSTSKRFHQVVDSVEAKSVPPERVAELVWKSLTAKHPRYVYNLNRNILLRIMAALPDHLQVWILKAILK